MPKRSYRRRTFRRGQKRRTFRRRKFMSKVKTGVHYFKRSYITSINTYDWPVIYTQGWDFFLSQLPNYTEFTNLYNEYKVSRIKVKFMYSANSQDVSTALLSTALPTIYTAVDPNDSTLPTSVSELLQYKSFRARRADKPFSVYFKPQFATAAYSGTFTSYAAQTGWIDTSSPSVKHYGLKWIVDPMFYSTGTNVTGRLQTIITYYIKCRGTK